MTIKNFLKSREIFSVLVGVVLTIAFLIIGILANIDILLWLSLVPAIAVSLIGARASIKYESDKNKFTLLSEEFLSIGRNISEGIVAYTPQFKILYINKAAEKIFDIDAKKYIGKKIEPDVSKNQDSKTFTQIMFPLLASSVLQISEEGEWPQTVNILIDEPERKFNTRLDRIKDTDGNTALFIKLIRDETREQGMLDEKKEFINTAAHQLRTPLTAINWALENIKTLSEKESGEIASAASEALAISQRMLKITNDLLDVAKMEEGKFGYNFNDADLVGLIKEIVNGLSPVAAQKSVFISFEHQNIESLLAHVDTEKLGLAIFNIVDNAIKYNNPKGMVKITLETAGNEAKISVADSGVGMSKEDLNNLFKKFFRGSEAETMEANGNGLGLFIARNIITKHRGTITVESEINRGTTFFITIPLFANNLSE